MGKEWSAETVRAACAALRAELAVPDGAPGGQSEYRMALAASFLFKHFIATSIELAALQVRRRRPARRLELSDYSRILPPPGMRAAGP